MSRLAFVFDPDRCTACQACRMACDFANGESRELNWRRVVTLNPRRHPDLPVRHLSLACNHCDDPACLRACPAAAYHRDPESGAVLVDESRCMGCRYCAWVCPYAAPAFDEARGVMNKCTFCQSRLAAGDEPACVEVCPTGALALGTHEPGAPEPRAPGLPPAGLGPALQVSPAMRQGPPPMAPPAPAAAVSPWQPFPEPVIRPAAEWALLVLTLVLPLLAAWYTAGLLVPFRGPTPLPFLLAGFAALGLSAVHLRKPGRAWRAVSGWRTSWLSLEILAVGGFLLAGGATLLAPPAAPRLAGWLVVLLGVAALLAVDRVYREVPRLSREVWHGGEALPTATLFLGLFAEIPALVLAAAAVKVVLVVHRVLTGRAGVPMKWTAVRLALLAAACLPWVPWPAAVALALGGEIIERISFYAALEPASPAGHLVAVVAGWRRATARPKERSVRGDLRRDAGGRPPGQ